MINGLGLAISGLSIAERLGLAVTSWHHSGSSGGSGSGLGRSIREELDIHKDFSGALAFISKLDPFVQSVALGSD